MTATLLAFHPRTSPPTPTFGDFLARLDVPRIASYGSGLFRGDAVAALYRIARGETSRPVEEQIESVRYLDAIGEDIDERAATKIAESLFGRRAYAFRTRRGCEVGTLTLVGAGVLRFGAGATYTAALLDAARCVP